MLAPSLHRESTDSLIFLEHIILCTHRSISDTSSFLTLEFMDLLYVIALFHFLQTLCRALILLRNKGVVEPDLYVYILTLHVCVHGS